MFCYFVVLHLWWLFKLLCLFLQLEVVVLWVLILLFWVCWVRRGRVLLVSFLFVAFIIIFILVFGVTHRLFSFFIRVLGCWRLMVELVPLVLVLILVFRVVEVVLQILAHRTYLFRTIFGPWNLCFWSIMSCYRDFCLHTWNPLIFRERRSRSISRWYFWRRSRTFLLVFWFWSRRGSYLILFGDSFCRFWLIWGRWIMLILWGFGWRRWVCNSWWVPSTFPATLGETWFSCRWVLLLFCGSWVHSQLLLGP